MSLRPLALLAALTLAACGGEGPVRYDLPQAAAPGRVAVSVGSVEIREVSLPLYAELETITVESPEGLLVSDEDLLWADDPRRAATEGLALSLAAMTPAKVAAEPWPFSDVADVRVEVRVTRALPGADGQYRLSGQFYVTSPRELRADRARRFDIAVPYVPGDLPAIAAARAAAFEALARQIAEQGLR